VTTLTAGQAAHRRWHRVRWPHRSGEDVAADWRALSALGKAAWEAAGTPEPEDASEGRTVAL
jgi:hypothetical protein